MDLDDELDRIIRVCSSWRSLITFLVVVIIFGMIVWLFLRKKDVEFRCAPNECATSLATGEKRCGEGILYDPKSEVCNPKYSCVSSKTPYAVLNDGRTQLFGACTGYTPCRCVNQQTMNRYIASGSYVWLNNIVDANSQVDSSLLEKIKYLPCESGTIAFESGVLVTRDLLFDTPLACFKVDSINCKHNEVPVFDLGGTNVAYCSRIF
jgi:hypothetical protein